ncbi:MAG: hypothetical protein NT163_07960, partial [Chlorobiales bacterium]|nr:hypothetical protein [Chlorobiales bacterium]
MSITTTITGTTEQVTLDSEGLWVNPTSIDVTNSTVTSETITSNGTATNYTHLFNSGGNVNVLTITGNTFFSDDRTDGSFVSQLNSINASPDTGGIDIDTSLGILKSTFTFTGGSGVSILSISKASLDGLNAGFQLNGGLATSGNVLGIGGLSTLTGTSASIGEYKSLNATKGFQILGVGGTGNNVVINDAFLTNGFATHVVDGQDGGSFTVTNIGKTYTLDIFNNGYINPPQVSYNLSSAAATQTALTINLIPNWGPLPEQSPSPLAGLNVGKVTTTGGISSVALVSNIATSVNIINTYHGSDNQTLTITGNEAFAILGMTPNTTKGDTINASGFTQDLTLGTIG